MSSSMSKALDFELLKARVISILSVLCQEHLALRGGMVHSVVGRGYPYTEERV